MKLILGTLAVLLSALAAFGQQPQPLPKSAESSPNSGTAASDVRVMPSGAQTQTAKAATITESCNAAADELRASRILIDALETENAALRPRLETETHANKLLIELNETRRAENEALRATVVAKNETIAAKDAAIKVQGELISELKTKKRSPWTRIADILIGASIIAILK